MNKLQLAIKYLSELDSMHDNIDKYHQRLLELWNREDLLSDLEMDELDERFKYILRELEFICLKLRKIKNGN